MIVSVMFSGVIIYMRKHLDWLYSAQLVACLAHVAVIVNLTGHGFVSVNIRLCLYLH